MSSIRPAAVAGIFYPAEPDVLRRTLASLFQTADAAPDETTPKAIIAPHAGYRYSGALAAKVYARLRPARDRIKRVVLLGPCHRVALRGLALPSVEAFESPLRTQSIDKAAVDALVSLPQVTIFDETHAQEHSLEVHIPFLQTVLGDFDLVPLVVGDASTSDVATVLERLWGGDETLIVISSDLSHFLDYDAATEIDARTCAAIEAFDGNALSREQACGRHPLRGLLSVAKTRNMRIETVGLCNSGDTAGPRDRVVGYGGWALYETDGVVADAQERDPTADLIRDHGTLMLRLAAASIVAGLRSGKPVSIDPGQFPRGMQNIGACFVTLKKSGGLRSCIGSPEAHRPLCQDIAINGYRAAFNDPRFPSVESDECPTLDLSISILSPQEPMVLADENDLLHQLRPGIDGLVIDDRGKRALFLPSVWGQLSDPRQFVSHLKQKAGIATDHWSDGFRAWRFSAHEVRQSDLDNPASIWPGDTPVKR